VGRQALAKENGDTLIEVLISTVLIAIIVVGVLTGIDSTNRATSLDRSRSQANALAEQDEQQLRSEPISKLSEVSRTRTVAEGGTEYTIATAAHYVTDSTATTSCSSTSPSADYVKTTSTVTWKGLGVGKPVVQSSVISPPPGTALIVQVTDNAGAPAPEAVVAVTGPSNVTTQTSTNGCAILQLLPGEYAINVSKTGYVDQNGYLNTHEDLSDIRTEYLVAETSTKVGYSLALAGKLEVAFTGAEADSFVAYNTGMSAPRVFPGPIETYASTTSTPNTIYPFKGSKYTVYAGTCSADLPTSNSIASNPEVEVVAGTTAKVSVPVAPVAIKVMSGASSTTPGSKVSGAVGYTKDLGCENLKRSFTTNGEGAMPKPGLPFGSFSMCVGSGGGSGPRWEGSFNNNSITGPQSLTWSNGKTAGGVATIYLGLIGTPAPAGTTAGGVCP